jgi:hypothetical protein
MSSEEKGSFDHVLNEQLAQLQAKIYNLNFKCDDQVFMLIAQKV